MGEPNRPPPPRSPQAALAWRGGVPQAKQGEESEHSSFPPASAPPGQVTSLLLCHRLAADASLTRGVGLGPNQMTALQPSANTCGIFLEPRARMSHLNSV